MGKNSLTFNAVLKRGPWLHSAKLPAWQKPLLKALQSRAPKVKNLIWILSSGTTAVNEVKAIGVTKEALLASAAAVNRHLRSGAEDRWLLTLPVYHVGGLGILARAHLSKARVYSLNRWDTRGFAKSVDEFKITLTSLVPTQVHDLVTAGLTAPRSLRAVVIGGGALDPSLYARARELDWPLLPSYGLTECCSQVATAALDSLGQKKFPSLEILPHAEVRTDTGQIHVRAKSSCDLIARARSTGEYSLEYPLRDGWIRTEDLGEVKGRGLRVLGRADDVVKILGELVSVNQVEHEARAHLGILGGDLTVMAVPGGREGHRLALLTDSSASLRVWLREVESFNALVQGPQRIKLLAWVPSIPRGELGKVKRASLLADLRLC